MHAVWITGILLMAHCGTYVHTYCSMCIHTGLQKACIPLGWTHIIRRLYSPRIHCEQQSLHEQFSAHRTENPIYVFPKLKPHGLVPNSYIHVSLSDIPGIGLSICAAAKQADQSWKYINCSQIHEPGNWETEQYNSVLEITRPRSFLSGNTFS